MNESFVFYKSFYDAIKEFDNDTVAEFFKLVCQYALEGEITETDNKVARALFQMTIPQIEANRKRRENGKKGGAPTGNNNAKKLIEKQPKNNQKQPKVNLKNNQKQPNVNVNDNVYGYNTPTNVVVYNQEEKKNNINIIPKKEEKISDFDKHFERLAEPIGVGIEFQNFREVASKRFGIVNWELALKCFQEHIKYNGKESQVLGMDDSTKLRDYLSKALPYIKLSDEVKVKPKQEHYNFAEIQDPARWRKPCVRLANREVEAYGKKILVGVILQDGREWYTPPELPAPQSRFHYYNLDTEQYDDTSQHRPECSGQSVDYPPMAWIHSRTTDYYLLKNRDKLEDKQPEY